MKLTYFKLFYYKKGGWRASLLPLGIYRKKENQILQGLIFAEAANKSIRS